MRKLLGALALALVVLAAAVLVRGPAGSDGAGDGADPRLYYLVESHRPLLLDVPSGTRRVKLVSLLRLDEVPRERVEYGLRATLLDAGQRELSSAPVWFESRCTRATAEDGDGNGAGVRRRAYLPSAHGELTDERVVELDLGDLDEQGGALRLELEPGSPGPVLVRAFRRHVRRNPTVRASVGHAGERKRRIWSRRIGVSAWSGLHPADRRTLVASRWRLMQAVGSPGRDYVTEHVVLTGLPTSTRARRGGGPGVHLLEPGRALAVNVRGPAALEVTVEDASGAGGGAHPHARLVTVGQDGAADRRDVAPGARGRALERVAVPAGGVASVTVLNDGDGDLAIAALLEDPRSTFGDPEIVVSPGGGGVLLGPDVQVQRMWRLDAHLDPGRWELPGREGDVVRVEAMVVAGRPARVAVELQDGEGGRISSAAFDVAAGPSPYEEVRTSALRDVPVPAGPGEVRLVRTGSARLLVLSSDAPVDVRVSVPSLDPSARFEPRPEYALDGGGAVVRYAPARTTRWDTVRPLDEVLLASRGRESHVRAQVRLEPRRADDPGPLGWRTAERSAGESSLQPEGALERLRLFEPAACGASDDGRCWTALRPGRPRTVDLSPGDGGAGPRIEMWVEDPRLLGRDAVISVDGRPLARIPLSARAVGQPLPRLERGLGQILLDAPADEVAALIDRPPRDGGGETYRSRTVVRFEPGVPLRAAFDLPRGDTASVLLLAYLESGGDVRPRVRVRVQGQSPPATGVPVRSLTAEDRVETLAPAGGRAPFLADRRDTTLVETRAVRAFVGEDLSGQRVTVSFERMDGGPEAWARLVLVGAAEDGSPPARGDQGTAAWLDGADPLVWADPFRGGDDVAAALAESIGDGRGAYEVPTDDQLAAARSLAWQLVTVARADAVASLPGLAAEARSLGLVLEPLRQGDERFILLRDGGDRGAASLLVRMGGASEVLLQAPHAFTDLRTGTIVARMAAGGRARAALCNARRRDLLEPVDGVAPADVAHDPRTWFEALSLGLLDAGAGLTAVQLHGFDGRREEELDADVVIGVAAGPRAPTVESVVRALRREIPGIRATSASGDAAGLGGTTNVLGRAVASMPDAGFLHLELSPEMRRRLVEDAGARRAFDRALAGACGEGGAP